MVSPTATKKELAPFSTPDNTAIIDSKTLLTALKLIKNAVSMKTTLPVLQNVLIEAIGMDQLRIRATNLELALSVKVPALISGPLAITVDYRLFTALLPAKGDVMLTTAYADNRLRVEAGKSRANLKTIPATEFPTIPDADPEKLVNIATLSRALLMRAINEVGYSASADDSRPQLASVCMQIKEDGTLYFVAADGFRLCKLNGAVIDGKSFTPGQYLLPGRSLMELDVLDAEEIVITTEVGRNFMRLMGDNVEAGTRLIEGRYVDVQRVIPPDWGTRFVITANDLLDACKSLKPFAKDSANIMRLRLDNERGTLQMEANAAEVGDRIVEVSVTNIDGNEEMYVALNINFVEAMAAKYKGQDMVLETKTYQSPAVFKVGDDWLGVIMPMYLPNR